ncbi:unnamed protein product [Discosporangium mesarthrocarpum]
MNNGVETPRWDVSHSLRRASSCNPQGIACRTLTGDGKQIAKETTWAELHRCSCLLAEFLEGLPQLSRGQRVGVVGRNSEDYLQFLYACGAARIIIVPLNTRWSVVEFSHAIVDSGVKVLAVLDDDFMAVVKEAVMGVAGSVLERLIFSEAIPHGGTTSEGWRCVPLRRIKEHGMATEAPQLSDTPQNSRVLGTGGKLSLAGQGFGNKCIDDVFCIVYTSGTTGRSKGVALTHEGQVCQAMSKCLNVGYTSRTAFLNVVPLYHVGGINSALAVTMAMGCHVFLPRFSSPSAAAAMLTAKINTLVVVPTMLHMMLVESGVTDLTGESGLNVTSSPFEGVETVLVGGQSLSHKLKTAAQHAMPKAHFVQTYACTEAGSTMTFLPLNDSCSPIQRTAQAGASSTVKVMGMSLRRSHPRRELQGVPLGTPAQHVELRVMQWGLPLGVGKEVGYGVVGEIETRGPHVMKGYWGRPDLTEAAFQPGGWFRTGDLGWLEEGTGCLHFVGRQKNVIKTGGENVHASEVENVLLGHDWVADAAVYGINDERLGEKVAASVVLQKALRSKNVHVAAVKVLRDYCRHHLTSYKQPRHIAVVSQLPRNSSGKVDQLKLLSSL